MGGCFGAHGHGGNNEGIKLQVKRLRLYITQQMQKQIQECMKLEKMLIGQFQKEKSYRAMLAQDSIINQIVEGINRNHCFAVVRHQCDKIVDYSHHMDDKEKARQTLFPSFRIVLYAQSILKDLQISHECKTIQKRFPQVKQAEEHEIDSQIMKHHKNTKEPTLPMKNEYILNLCNQQNIKLETINVIGHSYKFGL